MDHHSPNADDPCRAYEKLRLLEESPHLRRLELRKRGSTEADLFHYSGLFELRKEIYSPHQ